MKEGYKFIKQPDGSEREVDWAELNQLKKDILWIFDENFGDIGNAFVPPYSFSLKYWEYLTLDGDKWFYEEERVFYHRGVLVVLLCLCSEYIDVAGGSQDVFNRKELPIVAKYVEEYLPRNQQEQLIRERILLGLSIAQSMTEDDVINNEFVHEDNDKYYQDINNIGNAFILDYYKSKMKNN